MKKVSKSLLAFCLCLLLLATTVVPAFAATGAVKTLKVAATTVSSITLKWSKATGAKSYQLQQYIAKAWKTIAITKEKTYTVENLGLNDVCRFRVRGVGKTDNGAYSPVVKASPAQVPSVKVSKLTATSAVISWEPVTGMIGYRVQQYADKTWTTVVNATKKTTVTLKTFLPGAKNKIRILAYTKQNGATVFGNNSPVFVVETPMIASPTGLKAAKVTSTAIKLSWKAVPGAANYIVYLVKGSTQKVIAKPTETQAIVQKLSPGTEYTFTVRTVSKINEDRYYSPFAGNLNVYTAPAKVKGLKAAPADTTLTLSWKAVKSAGGYQIRLLGGAYKKWTYIGSTDKTTYTIENLSKSTVYQAQVRAYHTVNGTQTRGVYSAALKTKTLMSGATNFTVTGATVDSISLSWKPAVGATSYVLEQSTNGTTFKAADAMQAKDGSLMIATVYGLSANTTYVFRLTPKSATESGVPALVSGTTAPGTVTGLTASQISGAIKLSWSKTPGATGYEISAYDAESGWATVGTTTRNSFVVDGLTDGKDYVFRVTAYYLLNGKKQYGTPSESVSTKVLPAAVTNLSVTNVDTTSFTATWMKNPAASDYKLSLSKAQGSYEVLSVKPVVSGNYVTATISGLSNGTEYTLNVSAIVDGTESLPATISVKTVSPKVTGLTATAQSADSISLSWSAAQGAERYEIQQSTSASGSFTTIATVTAMPYVVTGLSAGTTYYFRICAVSTSGGLTQKGAFSTVVSAKTTTAAQTLSAPTNVKATDASSGTNYQIQVTWTAVSGATSYEVSIRSGSSWRALDTVSRTSYTATGLSADTVYSFRVRAISAGGTSDYSDTASARTATAPASETVAAPTGVKAVDSSSSSSAAVIVSWTAVSGATSYKVYMSTGGTWKEATSVASTSCIINDLAANTTYYFRVRAVKNGTESADSATVSVKTGGTTPVTTLSAPTGVKATDSSNGTSFSITLNWNGVSGAANYEVSINNGGWKVLGTTAGTAYTATGLASGSTYSFRVRAMNGSVYSDYSATVSATTSSGSSSDHQTSSTALTGLSVSLNNNGRTFTVKWKDVSNAVYAIDRWDNAAGKWVSTGGTRYDSQITIEAQSSDFGTRYAAGSDNTSSLTWNSVSGASGYEVRSEAVKGSQNWFTPLATTSTSASLRLPPNMEQSLRITALGTVKLRIYALNMNDETKTVAYAEYSPRAYLAFHDFSCKTPAVGALSSSSSAGLKEAYALMAIQAINNTRYETAAVTMNARSHMHVEPTDYSVRALGFIPIPQSMIKEAMEEAKSTQDVTSSCRYEYGSGKATIVSTVDGAAPATTSRSSILQEAIVPNSGLSYLYDQHNLNSFTSGIQSVTATNNSDGSTTVKITVKKESFDKNSEARFHLGLTESFANNKEELADLGNYQSSVGATTLTVKINKNYTLDSLDIVSPFSISATASESGITITLLLEGTSDYSYTFTR